VAPIDPFGLAGQVLDGQFRIERYVGEGGFSIVYRGTHVGLGEPIAVKCLKLPPAIGTALVDSFVKRFRDESRLHYKLSQGHLHIARSIASGTTVSPTTSALVPYTVLEWLDGQSLSEELDERRQRGLGGRSLAETVKLLDSAIDALAYAHAQGVVHRDLNPGNLFLTRTPSGTKLKVLDFGVAKIMADSWLAIGQTAKTMGNVRIFTPAFGAPEQFDERMGSIGPWTDVYAVALVVLEVLTGQTVMDGENLGELAAKATNPARPSPRALGVPVGDEVEAAMVRALAISPDERPRDAGEFWGLLKHAIGADVSSGRHAAAGAAEAHASVPSTVRMHDAPRAAKVGSAADGAARPIPSPVPAIGPRLVRTLRMPNAPGSEPPRPGAGVRPAAGRIPAPPANLPTQWTSEAIETPKTRGPLVVLVAFVLVVAVAMGVAWLLR
jgi:serine/threonine protein kinase